MAVRVPAAHRDALLPHVIAGEALMEAFRAVRVLQAETGFVSFSHPGSVQSQEIVVSEDFDAVVVPVTLVPDPVLP